MNLKTLIKRSREKRKAAAKAALALTLVGALSFAGLAQTHVAQADTVAYEFIGSWESAPASVRAGSDVLSAVWRFDINDDSPAPSNDPVTNNVVTFTAQNAKFTALPEVCLTAGVAPVSSLSTNETVLVCNIGTRNQGTAQISFTGLVPTGNSGDQVGLTGTFLDKTVDLPKIPIVNPFIMDAKFDGGSTNVPSGVNQDLTFGWSVSRSTGALPGPSTVSYILTVAGSNGETILGTPTCAPISTSLAGYPFSDTTHSASRTTKFPGCTLTRINTGANAGKYTLTLTGLSYNGPFPTEDASGATLPAGMDVIASGRVTFSFLYTANGTFTLSANTPTYTAVGATGVTSVDSATNNSNSQAYIRGGWTHGFSATGPLSQGSIWTDTYRTFPGTSVTSVAGTQGVAGNAACVALDTKYVTFESARVSNSPTASAYTGAVLYYFTGNAGGLLNPNAANYNPNDWTGCGSNTPIADGWTTTLPSDLTTVKAVMTVYNAAVVAQGSATNGIISLYVNQKISSSVSVGQDIWSWGSYRNGAAGNWLNGTSRSYDVAQMPGSGTATPGARYPFASGGRDVLRIIGSIPVVEKDVAQKEAGPGSEVDYTLRYGLSGDSGASGSTGQIVLVDKLPVGMSYVPGSAVPATPAPAVSGSVAAGQTLTWTINGVSVNKTSLDTLTFKAVVPSTATPGATYTNNVTATSNNQSATARASFVVPKAGYTTLVKTATTSVVPTVSGVADNSWKIKMTSTDPVTAARTDTVDILPYIGDGRGTTFDGSYKLKQAVTAVSGATVYYTIAPPTSLNEDPKDVSNGGFATVTGNTVGWSTTYTANATAVRVIGPALAYGQSQEFTVTVTTTGSKADNVFVNTAVGRSSDTQLRMRTSDKFTIQAMPAASMKKYVQDSSGAWHDAQTATDYPAYNLGDTPRYRLVVANTGNMDLVNLPVTDDKTNLGQLYADGKLTSSTPLQGSVAAGVSIQNLAVGQTATIEYDMVIVEGSVTNNMLVNSACVQAGTENAPGFADSCDPAGVKVYSSLAWEKISAYSETTFLSGSEWELIQVVSNGGAPVAGATALVVADCVTADPADCVGADLDARAGHFKVQSLEASWYRLVETKAPVGYLLDATPHFVEVSGVSSIGEGIVNELHEPPMLPLTGGVGTLWFWSAGGVGGLLVAAGLFWQRRRSLVLA